MKKKIIFFIPNADDGGIEKNLIILSNFFSNKNYKVEIIHSRITKNIAKAAMKKKENFDKLKDKFKNDPDIVLEALKNEGTWGDSEIFNKIDGTLKTNKEFLIKAVNIKSNIFNQISENLKKDKDIVLSTVSKNGFELDKIDESFKKDKSVVLAHLYNMPMTL